jgi:hypothetical protein
LSDFGELPFPLKSRFLCSRVAATPYFRGKFVGTPGADFPIFGRAMAKAVYFKGEIDG